MLEDVCKALLLKLIELNKIPKDWEHLCHGNEPIDNQERGVFILYAIKNYFKSSSQLCQDVIALAELKGKQNGFFIEFGLGDGIEASNTWILEREFGWNGIVLEPAKVFRNSIEQKRKCIFEKDKCVWKTSGEKIEFSEIKEGYSSTISDFVRSDCHADYRSKNILSKYFIDTISLEDLIIKHNIPSENLDYLSIDTEGSEYEILKALDFKKYPFKVITCEHNNSIIAEPIHHLLTSYGYKRKYEELSKWDSWYFLT